MEKQKFGEMIMLEIKVRSEMTMHLSKTKQKSFRSWFFKQGKKIYSWTIPKCKLEYENLKKTFNWK